MTFAEKNPHRRNDAEVAKDPNAVYFYGGPFSNFAHSEIFLTTEEALRQSWCLPPWAKTLSSIQTKRYIDVEHLFQAWKAPGEATHDWINAPLDTWTCKRRGNDREQFVIRPDWEDVKYDVMVLALRLKFAIPEYRNELLATGDRNIYEDSPTDFVWGFRMGGKNLLGKALMQVRKEIVALNKLNLDYEGDTTAPGYIEGAKRILGGKQ